MTLDLTDREKIIQLAEKCDFYAPGGLPSDWIDSDFMASPEQVEAFYHAAQREAILELITRLKTAEEQVSSLTEELNERCIEQYILQNKLEAAEKDDEFKQSESDQALNACITFVIHGDADFSGMNEGLVDYFKKAVAAMKESEK